MSQIVSKTQLAQLLRQAGFPEKDIPTMIGIAGGESRYRADAFNPDASTGDKSYGLFQINMLGALGPERRQQFGIKSNDQLFDPVTNVRAAKSVYDREGLGAWSVYKNNSYQDFLPTTAEIGDPRQVPPIQTPVDYPAGTITVNNYYGPQDQEFNKEKDTQSLIQTLLMNSMLQNKQSFGVPSIKEIMAAEGLGGGFLDPVQYLQNYFQ